ncbi:MAG: hypothetical protein J3K34DRAFT_401057 [Monoraphidium minutum]|nr:MAG: hypothetical protein J3K34DRAFT_401057 [Monoraphidium minutum]
MGAHAHAHAPGHTHRPRRVSRLMLLMAASLGVLAVLLCSTHLIVAPRSAFASRAYAAAAHTQLSVAELYGGRTEWPTWERGPYQILVLAYEHSRAQLLTRLLMLSGVFAGEPKTILSDADSSPYGEWELEVRRAPAPTAHTPLNPPNTRTHTHTHRVGLGATSSRAGRGSSAGARGRLGGGAPADPGAARCRPPLPCHRNRSRAPPPCCSPRPASTIWY